ncbi:hypothetical protein [Massilia sp. PWRC2]|uniref:hypothetical protein n=1 Tax=Massilia sp. PWRC2 TaxID=2804626 RepID=UPI003CE9473E
MKLSDDILMAYADGELDENVRRQVELAMQADAAVAARVRQHLDVRHDLQRAYAGVLEGALPAPLQALLAGSGGTAVKPGAPLRPKVIQLDSVRAARRASAPGAAPARAEGREGRQGRDLRGDGHQQAPLRMGRMGQLGRLGAPRAVLVATLLVGLIGGIAAITAYHGETAFATLDEQGMLRAHGKLDTALNVQLASGAQTRGRLRIGISFVSREGPYCRAFELGAAAGLACRAGAVWQLPVLIDGNGTGAGAERAVGSAFPAVVLAAIDARAVGPALDARAEQVAAARGWAR